MEHLTDELFTAEELKTLFSIQDYWKEILKRDEPRRSDCCRNEVQSMLSRLTPAQMIHLMNKGLETIDDETIT